MNNLRFNHVSQIVINNVFNLLLKKHISFEKLKENLYKHLSKNKVDNFFEEKEECDDRMIIALSKEALQKELITMSYASYLLNKNISEIMELDNE